MVEEKEVCGGVVLLRVVGYLIFIVIVRIGYEIVNH